MLKKATSSLAKTLLHTPVTAFACPLASRVPAPVAVPLRARSTFAAHMRAEAALPRAVPSIPRRGFFTKHVATEAAKKASAGLPPLGSAAALKHSNEDWELVYEGNISKPLTQLKMMSAGSLVLALISAPVIVTFDTETMDETGRMLLAAVTLTMGIGTTAMTNFIATPYVCRFFVSRANPHIVEIITASFTGKMQSFRMDVTEPVTRDHVRPLVTFQHPGTKRYFYIQEEFCTHPVFGPLLPHLFEAVEEPSAAVPGAPDAPAA